MKIPKSFEMMNRKIEVIIKDESEHMDKCGLLGHSNMNIDVDKPEIVLKKAPKSVIQETFIHEFIHLLFDVVSEKKLSKNEKLVILMAQVTTQAINTMKFDDKKKKKK